MEEPTEISTDVSDATAEVQEQDTPVEETGTPTADSSTGFKIKFKRDNPFMTGFDIQSEEELKKRALRAQKFNIPVFDPLNKSTPDSSAATDSVLTSAFPTLKTEPGTEDAGPPADSMEDQAQPIEDAPESKRFVFDLDEGKDPVDLSVDRRYDTVHIFASKLVADNWKTKDLLKYFDEFSPSQVEWISGTRCNVVFGDPFSAKRAMFNLSRTLPDEVAAVEDQAKELGAPRQDLEYLVWREGRDHSPESSMYMRVATVADVKLSLDERKKSKSFKVYWARNGPREWRERLTKVKDVKNLMLTSRRRPKTAREVRQATEEQEKADIEASLTEEEKLLREEQRNAPRLNASERNAPLKVVKSAGGGPSAILEREDFTVRVPPDVNLSSGKAPRKFEIKRKERSFHPYR